MPDLGGLVMVLILAVCLVSMLLLAPLVEAWLWRAIGHENHTGDNWPAAEDESPSLAGRARPSPSVSPASVEAASLSHRRSTGGAPVS